MSTASKTTDGELLDVQNVIDNCRDLLGAVFMASAGLGDRHHTNAIQAVCDVMEHNLIKASSMVTEIREAL